MYDQFHAELQKDEDINVIQKIYEYFFTNIRHLYFYSVLDTFNVTDPYKKLYYLKELDENIFSEKAEGLLRKYPSTIIKARIQKGNALDPKIFETLKLYTNFTLDNVIIPSIFNQEMTEFFIRALIETANYSDIYQAKNIPDNVMAEEIDEEIFHAALLSSTNRYIDLENNKQKSL